MDTKIDSGLTIINGSERPLASSINDLPRRDFLKSAAGVALGLMSGATELAAESSQIEPGKEAALRSNGTSSEIVSPPADDERGVINNTHSPTAKFKSVNIGDCVWTSGFWGDKFKLCTDVMVPHMGELLMGDVGNAYNMLKISAGMRKGKFKGTWWQDGDFYKWMEAVSYVYAAHKDEKLLNELDEIIGVIGKAQAPDGYLASAITLQGLPRYLKRWQHELYCSGHMFTSACIHYRATGKTNFLNIAIKNADCVYREFQPRPKKLARFGYNQSQIMGLVELYRTTKDKKYLELAEIFVNMRGASPVEPDPTVRFTMIGDQTQERTPFREEKEAVGHAVLALYFYAGAADLYAETGEQELLAALDRVWSNIANKKMYLTGACGQTPHGASSHADFVHEAFINEYMMPNLTAYNETCANVAHAMFNWRMLSLRGEARYGDNMELVLINALSGISADGMHYFYCNPLRVVRNAIDYGALTYLKTKLATPVRQPHLNSFCCPPNLVRTIAKSSNWAYNLSENGIAVNLYGGNRLATHMLDGSEIKLTQESQYPWDGAVKITMQSCKSEPFDVMLRIPQWAERTTIMVNGSKSAEQVKPGNFTTIRRSWKSGDVIEMNMPMEARLYTGHPRIEEVRNQAAIKRGPVVYCMETQDLPPNASILDVYIPANTTLVPEYQPTLLGGLSTLRGTILLNTDTEESMYRTLQRPDWKKVEVKFLPYYAWGNRGQSEMTVWMPIVWV